MNVIADGLHARVPWGRASKKLPGRLRQQVGLAITAAQEEQQSIFRQILHGVLPGLGHNLVGFAVISNHAVCRKAEAARGREYAVALVAKAVAIGSDRNGGLGGQAVENDHVGGAGIVDIQNKDDRRGSWKAINQFITDPELHWKIPNRPPWMEPHYVHHIRMNHSSAR